MKITRNDSSTPLTSRWLITSGDQQLEITVQPAGITLEGHITLKSLTDIRAYTQTVSKARIQYQNLKLNKTLLTETELKTHLPSGRRKGLPAYRRLIAIRAIEIHAQHQLSWDDVLERLITEFEALETLDPVQQRALNALQKVRDNLPTTSNKTGYLRNLVSRYRKSQ